MTDMWKHAEDIALAQFSKSIDREADNTDYTTRLSRNTDYESRFATVERTNIRQSHNLPSKFTDFPYSTPTMYATKTRRASSRVHRFATTIHVPSSFDKSYLEQ